MVEKTIGLCVLCDATIEVSNEGWNKNNRRLCSNCYGEIYENVVENIDLSDFAPDYDEP